MKKRIISFILRKFIKVVSADEVLMIDKRTGKVTIGGRTISDQDAQTLINYARLFENNVLWGEVEKAMFLTIQEKLMKHGNEDGQYWMSRGYLLCMSQMREILAELQKAKN